MIATPVRRRRVPLAAPLPLLLPLLLLPLLVLPLLFLGACADLGGYSGRWSGDVVGEPAVLAGLPSGTRAVLDVERVDRVSIAGRLELSPPGGGAPETVTLRPVARAANDGLGSMELPDAPLRSYLVVAPLAAGDALAVVSLYPDDRVVLRLLRSDTLYGVFPLGR